MPRASRVFATALQHSVLICCALAAGNLAARAETVRLRCNENPPGSPFAMTVDVDFANNSVFTVFDIGENQAQRSPAQITDRFIYWHVQRTYPADERLDRATGLLMWRPNSNQEWLSGGSCHRIEGKNVL